jgi:hypothetical protein
MSLLTSICISDIGSIPQDGLVNIYTNSDNYETPLLTDIPISAMTGDYCPYQLTVPNDTTSIHIDYENLVRICLESSNPCTTCDLGFDTYSQNSIGQVVVGNLTGSCDTITDYFINWYGPQLNDYDPANPDQNIAFTSGKGTLFPGYNFLHPMVGTQSPPMLPGNYVPVISKVKLNGTIFSLTGGSGTVQSNLNCLYPTVVISAYTCSDSNTTNDPYSNVISFYTTGEASIPPNSLSTVLKIDTNINYLALELDGFSIYDTFKIQFSGTSYDVPLTLEYISIGSDTGNENYQIDTMPKVTYLSTLKKVLCFTGLTRSVDDYLLISVIPNQTNNATSWVVKWKCLETFDCSMCIDTHRNSPYKIIGSSIKHTSGSCNTFGLNLTISGCSINQQKNNQVDTYMNTVNYLQSGINNNTNLFNLNFGYTTNSEICESRAASLGGFLQCRPDVSTGTITSRKYLSGTTNTINVLEFTFTDVNDFNLYYNSYLNTALIYSGTPYDSSNLNYYRYYFFQICTATGNQRCGDNSSFIWLWIHPSTVVTTGQTGLIYSLSFTMPKIYNEIDFSVCQLNCESSLDKIINDINYSTDYPPFSFTTNVGARFTNLIVQVVYVSLGSQGSSSSTYNSGYMFWPKYTYQTYVYSGGNPTYTIIPSLSAVTCEFNSVGYQFYNYNFLYLFNYQVVSPDLNDLDYFEIYGSPLVDWVLQPSELIYQYSGGTVLYSNPSYIV